MVDSHYLHYYKIYCISNFENLINLKSYEKSIIDKKLSCANANVIVKKVLYHVDSDMITG